MSVPTQPAGFSSTRRVPHGVDLLTELRRAAELAADVGAVDAAVAVERGGDLRVIGSVAGTFPQRAFASALCPTALEPARWLSGPVLSHLYLPPHAHVLATAVIRDNWRGVLLLRCDQASEGVRARVEAALALGDAAPLAA